MRTHRHPTRHLERAARRAIPRGSLPPVSLRNVLLQNLLLEKPSWRIRDDQGRWFCPFCARATGIDVAASPTKESLARMEEHLRGCEAFWTSGGVERSQAFLEFRARVERELALLRGPVRERLSRDPLWQCRDLSHLWICPFCRRVIPGVRWLPGTAPERISEAAAAHLAAECIAYRKSVEESVRLGAVQTLPPPPAVPKGSALTPKYDAWIEQLRRKVEDGRGPEEPETETHMAQSLRKARQIQKKMLPALPDVPGARFAVLYNPCEQVSGDFYDFVPREGGEIAFLVGDAAGHGIEAALVMAMAKKILQVAGREGPSASEALTRANAELFPDLGLSAFLTVFFAILDPGRRTVRFARAGHPPLVLFNPARPRPLHVLKTGGIAIGLDRGPLFDRSLEEYELKLRQGDLLVLYTDGILEMRDARGEEFGMDRLLAAIQLHGRGGAEAAVQGIEAAVRAFRGDEPPQDDVTAVAMRIE